MGARGGTIAANIQIEIIYAFRSIDGYARNWNTARWLVAYLCASSNPMPVALKAVGMKLPLEPKEYAVLTELTSDAWLGVGIKWQ